MLSRDEREHIFTKINHLVRRKFFDPQFNGRNWPQLADSYRERIVSSDSPDRFEASVNELLQQLGTSHLGFFRAESKVPSRNSIDATFRQTQTAEGLRWMFQDVQPGGPAAVAGARPTDVLLRIDDDEIVPPKEPAFRMGHTTTMTVLRSDGSRETLNFQVNVPPPKYPKYPYADSRSVVATKINAATGLLKVTKFPGIIGVDFAHEVDRGVRELRGSQRLILDLRGNPGGGIGGLRLMSYLTPGRLPVGYSLTRYRAEHGYSRESLPRLNGIPDQKWMLPFLALRFVGRDQSIVVVTEGLGQQTFHGRIVILVNEHTAGSGEMVAGFAKENGLAKIVGMKTAGRLLGAEGFSVDGGYVLALPIASYLSWNGHRFEGNGVSPEMVVDWDPKSVSDGTDNQLKTALDVVSKL